MITVEYKPWMLGYVWPNPPRNVKKGVEPTEFHISLHWPDRCSTTKWWSKRSTPNACKQRTRGFHRDFDDNSATCKSLFILGVGLEFIVMDDDIEHICKIRKIFRRRCEVIVIADIMRVA